MALEELLSVSKFIYFAFIWSHCIPLCYGKKKNGLGREMKSFILLFPFTIYDPSCFSDGFEVLKILVELISWELNY